jgi:SAM-dependent methyltransferase
LPVLFALTLFASSALLFLVQPMVARMVLPLLGGTPSVWNTCMVFFQALLLGGYAYAHAAPAWLGVRRQAAVHLVVLALPLALLPVTLPAGWGQPEGDLPVFWLLGLLGVVVGLPFLVLSTTAPLLQKWFADTDHPSGRDPYFLYVASNLGSMLALLSYPFLLEPALPLSEQTRLWSIGYGIAAVLTAGCALLLWRSPRPAPAPVVATENGQGALPWTRRGRWVLLAFVPSSLLLSVTSYLTTDIAAIPLLWVVPLSLYLLTFILVFGRRQRVPQRILARWLPLVVVILVLVLLSEATEPVALLIGLHLAGLFWIGLFCHGALAQDRPPTSHLTEFYLWLSVGGVLGGLFNALLAPLLFTSLVEYPLVLILACLLRGAAPVRRIGEQAPCEDSGGLLPESVDSDIPAPPVKETEQGLSAPEQSDPSSPGKGEGQERNGPAHETETPGEKNPVTTVPARRLPGRERLDLLLPLTLGMVTAALVIGLQLAGVEAGPVSVGAMFGVPAVICYTFLDRPLRFSLGIVALLLAGTLYAGVHGRAEHRVRSFFGVHRVTLDPTGRFRMLVHGNTIHGQQSLEPADEKRLKRFEKFVHGRYLPLTYYHPKGPIGQVFAALQERPLHRVGVVGLGAGAMACYAEAGQEWTFFEIDPAVIYLARDSGYFTYLKDCMNRGAHLEIVPGDARLTLAGRSDQFDLLVIDAFSSDAIPVHLLTREALAVYRARLAPGGVLAFNISNRYLDLKPVLAGLARDAEPPLVCRVQDDLVPGDEEKREGKAPSQWVVMAASNQSLGKQLAGIRWDRVRVTARTPVWTDDYSNLFGVFKWE